MPCRRTRHGQFIGTFGRVTNGNGRSHTKMRTVRRAFRSKETYRSPFASIRRELDEAQYGEGGDDANMDYIFDIPLKVAQTLVGFKHDEACWLHGSR